MPILDMGTVFVLISALCAYTIPGSDRACYQLSNGGFGLKIGQCLAELWPFFVKFIEVLHQSGCISLNNGPIFNRKPPLESS